MKSLPLIWHQIIFKNIKSTVKISSILVAFLENMNFKNKITAVTFDISEVNLAKQELRSLLLP